MDREIGSEFWSVPLCEKRNHIFPVNTKWFLSGRTALEYIINYIKSPQIKTAALPSWCCESMILPFIKAGMTVLFYPVFFEQGKLVQKVNQLCDVILVMDYFGYRSELEYSSYPGIVIRDLTHSIFNKGYEDADYYFGSLRKWCGFLTGGFAWGREEWGRGITAREPDPVYISLRQEAMCEKRAYIHGEHTDKDHFLYLYKKTEEMLNKSQDIQTAMECDIQKAKNLDVEFIRSRRRSNAKILLNSLSEMALFPEMKEVDCPLFVPVLLNGRETLRQHLIQNHVYCPVHWTVSKYHKLDKKTGDIYGRELSIICDQRYNKKDMERICNLIKQGKKEC